MRTLVLGANGFIGGALTMDFLGRGVHVDNDGGNKRFDLTKPDLCKMAVRDAEVVYICAGVTGGSGLIASDPLSLVTPNLLIHAHLFAACKAAGVRKVICLSSTTGYPDSDAEMREEDYFTGELHGAYFNPGHTRRFIERLGAMYPELNIVFLRPSVVYGPGDDYNLETCHVIPALVRKVAERQNPLVVWGDGSNWRDGVYIDDVVRALVLAADAPAGAYNIACGQLKSIIGILDVLMTHQHSKNPNYKPEAVFDLSKPSMLKKRILNIEKAKRVLGWKPTITMDEGLTRTIDWYASR